MQQCVWLLLVFINLRLCAIELFTENSKHWPYFNQVCLHCVELIVAYSPPSFKRRLWYISHRYHLFSRSDPHYGPVVTLRWTHVTQTGERSPRKCPLKSPGTERKEERRGFNQSHV